MATLSKIGNRIVNDKYQKFVKAGYLNEKLQLTPAGRLAIDHITLEANEAALEKAADEKIARDEDAAKNGTCAVDAE